jgi:hypothetical protein
MVSSPLASDCIFCCRWYSQISAYTPSLDGILSLTYGCIICLYFFPGWFLLLDLWLYHLLKLIPWMVSSPWPLAVSSAYIPSLDGFLLLASGGRSSSSSCASNPPTRIPSDDAAISPWKKREKVEFLRRAFRQFYSQLGLILFALFT